MNARTHVADEADNLPAVSGELMHMDSSLAIEMNRVEIDQSIATARRYPRQLSRISTNILSLVTLDEETAEECMYALPRGGKPIKGPSARFAEVVKTQYGNCRVASRVIAIDRNEKVVIAEGIFHDLESNVATRAEIRRGISSSSGKLYNNDMIIMTGNAAGAIALRNATLGGVPKPLWRSGYEAVQRLIAGDIKTLAETREKAIRALATFGVAPEQVFAAVGLGGVEDIKLDHIPVLRGMFSALKNGEATVEEMFTRPTVGLVTANTSLTDRLRAKQGASSEGFTASQGEQSAEIDKALDGDKVPEHDAKTGEVTETKDPPAGDGFPGDLKTAGAATDATGADKPKAEPAKKPLTQRIAAFKVAVDEAETTVRALSLKAANAVLWKDVDRADPDEVGTSAELETYLNARCTEIEAADRAKGDA